LGEQLVGRRQELAAIDAFLGEDARGAAALVLEGEAGIGKTSVWREGVERARGRGFRVLTARPVGAEVRLSFAGLGDLLGEVVEEVLPSLPEPQRQALEAALLLAESRGSPDLRAVGVAFAGVLTALSRGSTVLVAVDDLQWLDRPSGQLLAFALRRLDGEPVRLLAAVRAEPGVGVPFELDRALGEARLQRLPLGPLSLGALYELVRARLGLTLQRAALVRLHETSAGNPFFALEIGRELVRRGLEPAPEQPLPIPGDLQALLRRRLARLPEPTRNLLLAASALPRPTVGLLEAALAPPEEVAAALDRALRAGVIDLEGEEVRFSHPLLASVCYSDASPGRRRWMHARLTEVVDDPEARARHLSLAVDGADLHVAQALEQAAAHAAARGAPLAAAEYWEAAARFTPSDRLDERGRHRKAAASARHRGGDLAGARVLLEDLVDEAREGPERAELLLLLARTRDDDLAAAIALCNQALAEAGGDEALSSRIHGYLSLAISSASGFGAALVHARRALELAERVGDPELLAPALVTVAWGEQATGELTPGVVERTLALREDAGLVSAFESSSVLRATWLATNDHLDEAREQLEAGLEQAAAAGGELALTTMLGILISIELRAGNWPRADELASQGCELHERRGLEVQGSEALSSRALVDAHLGRVEQCRSASEQGAALAEAAGDEGFRLQNLSALGFLELSLGDFDAAAARLCEVTDRFASRGGNFSTIAWSVWTDAVEALIGVGALAEASTYLKKYEELARPFPSRWPAATAGRCHGLVAAAEGDLERARASMRKALVEHHGHHWPFDRARTLLALGAIERRAKQKRAAREALGAALLIFEQLGARLWAERARGELARIGGRASAADELTPAERRVAELVAEGRTNREAASLLVVSEHTVDSHLRRVYRKLGVRSRAELAHQFAEQAQPRTGLSR
jgi:DNA-binding CsgD family transcriptional regulator